MERAWLDFSCRESATVRPAQKEGTLRRVPSLTIRPDSSLGLVHEALHICVDAEERRCSCSAGYLRRVRDRRLGGDGELVLEVSWLHIARWSFGEGLDLQVLPHVRPPEAALQGDLDV